MIIHVGGLSMYKITQNSQLNMFTGQQYLKIKRKMQIVLVYRYYNDGIVYYNLTFCTKKSLMTDLG